MLNRLAFCQNPLWPSRWMSAGLLASAKGDWSQAGYHLMVLSAHAGLLYLTAAVVAHATSTAAATAGFREDEPPAAGAA